MPEKKERFKIGYRRDQWVVVDQLCKAMMECSEYRRANLALNLLNHYLSSPSDYLWQSSADGKTL